MEIRLIQSKNQIKRKWRGGLCQTFHVVASRNISTTASLVDIGKSNVGDFTQSFTLETAQPRG